MGENQSVGRDADAYNLRVTHHLQSLVPINWISGISRTAVFEANDGKGMERFS